MGMSLAASCRAGMAIMPCASIRPVPARPTAVPATTRPPTAMAAAACRNRRSPAPALRPRVAIRVKVRPVEYHLGHGEVREVVVEGPDAGVGPEVPRPGDDGRDVPV